MTPTTLSSRALRRIRELRAQTGAVEFGPLGSAVKWRKPFVGSHSLPVGSALYLPPSAVRKGGGNDPNARRGGAVITSDKPLPDIVAKAGGYGTADSLNGALRRHEIVHSIQTAKRGYKSHKKIRELVKDEVGAYASMNRGVKGGSKVLRAANIATALPASVAVGVLRNPRLLRRAAGYGAGAAVIGGGLIAARKLREDRKDMGALSTRILALATRLDAKLLNFAAAPRRDPKTGAFTVGGNVTAGALRKAWGAPRVIPARIKPRQAAPAIRAPRA